jgi:hypothetical protein
LPGYVRGPLRGGKVAPCPAEVPLEEVAPAVRERVRQVLDKPTLATQGPSEVFVCRPELYHWFLEHPDRASLAWRRLGAQCVEITDRGGGRFGWSDGQGSDVRWDTVYHGPRMRVWYAEGRVRPGPLLPFVPVRAVVVVNHTCEQANDECQEVRHRVDLYLLADGKGAALATRLLGASGPRMAEQYVAQMEMFFSGLSWYLHRHPEKADLLLADDQKVTPARHAERAP